METIMAIDKKRNSDIESKLEEVCKLLNIYADNRLLTEEINNLRRSLSYTEGVRDELFNQVKELKDKLNEKAKV